MSHRSFYKSSQYDDSDSYLYFQSTGNHSPIILQWAFPKLPTRQHLQNESLDSWLYTGNKPTTFTERLAMIQYTPLHSTPPSPCFVRSHCFCIIQWRINWGSHTNRTRWPWGSFPVFFKFMQCREEVCMYWGSTSDQSLHQIPPGYDGISDPIRSYVSRGRCRPSLLCSCGAIRTAVGLCADQSFLISEMDDTKMSDTRNDGVGWFVARCIND